MTVKALGRGGLDASSKRRSLKAIAPQRGVIALAREDAAAVVQRARHNLGSLRAGDMVHLQRLVGNRAVGQLVVQAQETGKGHVIQRKVLFPNLEANNGAYPDSAIEINAATYESKPSNPFDDAETLNGKYNFATVDGHIIAAAHGPITPHHNDLAQDQDVDYAGTVTYANDEIETWNNHSGHYRPGIRWADQSQFPPGKFQAVGDESPWDYGTEMVVKRHGRTYRRKDEGSDWVEVKEGNEALDDFEEGNVKSSLIPKEQPEGCFGGCNLF